MKNTYSVPKLTIYGDVTEITQVLGETLRTDFAFFNGAVISGGNDIGSRNITCRNPDCS